MTHLKLADGVELYCGDCLEVLPTLAAGSVDLIWTDPPYGHNNNNDGDLIQRWEAALGRGPEQLGRAIANDGPEANDLFRAVLPEYHRLLKPGCCCCCCCCGGGPDPQFARWSLWLDEVLNFKQMVVWDKGRMGMGWHYRRSYETVLVVQKPGAACHWCTDRRDVENIIRPGAEGIAKIIPQGDEHPTAKPPELPAHFIRLHSLAGETVLDPFMGECSTGVACVRLGRRFIGIELDPGYFKIAADRIQREIDAKNGQGKTLPLYPVKEGMA
jgi:DNA modification methylase